MGCTNCGKPGGRYEKPPKLIDTERGSFEENKNTFVNTLNDLSFDELEKIKRNNELSEYEAFMSGFVTMSDDFKCSQIATFVDVINGDKFLPTGQSPQYCISFLHKILSMPEFECVNSRFPTLKLIIMDKFEQLQKQKIIIS